MTTRASGDSLAPWLGIAVVLLFALHDRFELVGNRVLILLALVVGAIGSVRRWRDAHTVEGGSPEARELRRRTLTAGAAFAALSVAIAVLRVIIESKPGLRGEIFAALVPPLLGWSIFLVLPIGLAPVGGEPTWAPALPRGVVIAAITFVATWIAAVARTHFDAIDEVLYTLQAHRFALGHATWSMDPELQRFVKLPLMVATPEGIYSQYPPGYPALLAPFARRAVRARHRPPWTQGRLGNGGSRGCSAAGDEYRRAPLELDVHVAR